MDRGAWQATVQGVTKIWTQLSTHTCSQIISFPSFHTFSIHKVFLLAPSGGALLTNTILVQPNLNQILFR